MKKIFGSLLLLLALTQAEAQSTYIVQFKDKGSTPFTLSNPSAYLSQASIARRSRYGIPYDSTDLPVTPRYIDSLKAAGTVTILNVSKWLNAVSIKTNDAAAITRINQLPFVVSAQAIAPREAGFIQPKNKFDYSPLIESPLSARPFEIQEDYFSYGASDAQIKIHKGEFLHNIGLRGQGIVIGLMDAGFQGYQNLESFDSAIANGQVLSTWDFVARHVSVNEDHPHGMQCLSIIAGNIPGTFVGSAPKASFHLFRTEDAFSEYPVEELNWVCGAERLDSAGGDLISSSLGYTDFDPPFTAYNHSYADMDGNTTLVTRGADLAAKKGILVVNSAGNEGNDAWHFIGAPADGDSVLAVGSVNSLGIPSSFSSYGPSADGRIKPDVASVGQGTAIQNTSNSISFGNGTSFAAPNMAGLTACLWQGFREFHNMQIIDALKRSANRFTIPNDRIGYGIPDMKKATMILLQQFASADAGINNCRTLLSWTSKDVATMKYEIERKLPSDTGYIKIAERFGTGSIFGNRSYQYEDILNEIPAGTIRYRIRQVIDTSVAGWMSGYIDSATAVHSVSCSVSYDEITLLPNPTRDQVSIRMLLQRSIPQLTVRFYNSLGQLMMEEKKIKPMGNVIYDFPVRKFSAGKYYVVLYEGNKILATKEMLKL